MKYVVVIFVALSACAGAEPAGNGGSGGGGSSGSSGSGGSGGSIDAPGSIDAGPDGAPLKDFGEPCNDKSECSSNICIFAGAGGICSRLCGGGSCPAGFGCFGVLGAVDPGVVSDVCVPSSTRLCTPCAADGECSVASQDLCLDYGGGQRFCGRDCRTISCPTGYTCQDVAVGSQMYRQCKPNSNACDCDATNMGTTQPCQITTPFGTCGGTRTCQGATGWGSCQPPSPNDVPDGTFTDSNCDGIDGNINDGIFVAPSGADSNTCGLTVQTPCLTLSRGILRALTEAKRNVYIQAGVYNEVVTLQSGVHLWGGYDTNWQRNARTLTGHEVRIVGGLDNVDQQYMTIKAHGLVVQTTVADLVIVGPNAAQPSKSSYAVHADNANLDLERVTIQAGNGANGITGATGQDAPLGQGGPGAGGGASDEYDTACDITSHGAAGPAGANSCPDGRNPNGGPGGVGGTMDTTCSCFLSVCVCDDCNASNGASGGNAAVFGFGFGIGGGGGTGQSLCSAATSGAPGAVANGAAGAAAQAGGLMMGAYFIPWAGATGGLGDNGSGGGGGGGSGGCDIGTDSYGAGGGGGGGGGCRARAAGGGGWGGGSSFGVFASSSTVTVTDSIIQRANAGNGGAGGVGGRGQSGGAGGPGGSTTNDSAPGAVGGAGAHGGHAGGGGGGAGGSAWGIYSLASSITPTNVLYTGGAAGNGGAGGPSAPSAPMSERDGNNGQPGPAGTVGNVGTCASANGC